MRAVLADLAGAPFMAPDAGRLRELGLDGRAIAAAARAGLLLRVSEQIVLAPGADAAAARALAALPQPFTAAEARHALGTTRRVAIPLLEYLDRAGPDPAAARRPPPGARVTASRARKKVRRECIGGLCPPSVQTRAHEGAKLLPAGLPAGGGPGFGGYRLRNSGERRSTSATRRAVPTVLATRSRNPPPCTRNTDAPGVSATEMWRTSAGSGGP